MIRARETHAKKSPIHYLGDFDVYVSGDAFEKAIDGFIEVVINRLGELGDPPANLSADAKGLIDLWVEICEERNDPEQTSWRKMEAMLGCDSDEAPEEWLETLLGLRKCWRLRLMFHRMSWSNSGTNRVPKHSTYKYRWWTRFGSKCTKSKSADGLPLPCHCGGGPLKLPP